MDVKIDETWKSKLKEEFNKEYFIRLAEFVREEYRVNTIYPPASLIFNAFNLCPFENIKAVIIGQDPYHGPGQAHGLCFSVRDGVDFPPSLINIFKEIELDLGYKRPVSGNLETMGQAGCAASECYTYCKGTSGRIASEKGMGRIYRCCYTDNQ